MNWYANLSIRNKILSFFLLAVAALLVVIIIANTIISNDAQIKSTTDLHFVYYMLMSLAVFVILLSIVSAITINKFIIRPINELVVKVNLVTKGNLKIEFLNYSAKDEVGTLYRAFTVMVNRLKRIAEIAESVSEGDLTKNLNVNFEGDVLSLSINKMIEKFKEISTEVSEEINQLGATAAELNSVITQFSSSVAETASSISETTATVEEVTKTSEVSNNKSKEVVGLMEEVSGISEDGKAAVQETLNSFQIIKNQISIIGQNIVRLTEFSQSIGEIINSVNDIAEQSNLLAVNASIEAARAGEQGKSFVIVAQEIKNLADKSKQATNKVTNLLGDIQNSINTAVLATEKGEKSASEQTLTVNKSGNVINKLSQTLETVKNEILQTSLTLREQFIGMDQITKAMENIKTAGEQNAVGANQLQETSITVKEVGIKLKKIISKLKL